MLPWSSAARLTLLLGLPQRWGAFLPCRHELGCHWFLAIAHHGQDLKVDKASIVCTLNKQKQDSKASILCNCHEVPQNAARCSGQQCSEQRSELLSRAAVTGAVYSI